MDARLAITDAATLGHLKAAHSNRIAKFAWQMGSFGAAFLALVVGVLGAGASAAFGFGAAGNLTALLFTLVPLAAAAFFFVAGRRAGATSRAEISEAWRSAVDQLYIRSGGRVTAEALAQGTGIPADEAAQLLAEAEVNQLLHAEPSAERLRIQDPGSAGPDEAVRAAQRELDEELGSAPTEAFEARLRK